MLNGRFNGQKTRYTKLGVFRLVLFFKIQIYGKSYWVPEHFTTELKAGKRLAFWVSNCWQARWLLLRSPSSFISSCLFLSRILIARKNSTLKVCTLFIHFLWPSTRKHTKINKRWNQKELKYKVLPKLFCSFFFSLLFRMNLSSVAF